MLLAKDDAFRATLYAEIEKQFDGDFNATYQTLAQQTGNDFVSIGTKLDAKVRRVSPLSSLTNELEAFREVEEGVSVYPQIYIHNYEELKKNGNITPDYTGKTPVILIHTGDNDDNSIGYTLNENNEIVVLRISVDEAFAEQNEVWVISINERVDNNGRFVRDEANSGTNDKTLLLNISPKFEKMTVKCHKESWRAGKSDIAIIRNSGWRNNTNPFTGQQQLWMWVGSSDASHIRDFTRKQINEKQELTINWTYYSKWHAINGNMTGAKGDWFSYIIFERDHWPTGNRNANNYTGHNDILGNPVKLAYVYRSADDFYALGFISARTTDTSIFAGTNSVDNGCIKFNSKL